jgi:FkbM family methyltransferase
MRNTFRRWLRGRGFDVVRYPLPSEFAYHLRRLLVLLEIDCVLDVGAAKGAYGQQLRHLGYEGRIVSVEPIDYQVETIRQAADEEWIVKQAAVGSRRGEARFAVRADPQMSSFLESSTYALDTQPHRVAVVETQEVQVVTLDELMDELVPPDSRLFVKLDVQGYEGEVLHGGRRAFERALGLQVELSLIPVYEAQPDYLTLLRDLRELGFSPTWFSQFPTREDLRMIEMDCLLRRA